MIVFVIKGECEEINDCILATKGECKEINDCGNRGDKTLTLCKRHYGL